MLATNRTREAEAAVGDVHDLSEWQQNDDTSYFKHHSWWWSWKVFQADDGLWYWVSTNHDGWDGSKLYDEPIDEAEAGFETWEAAAIWVDENLNMD